MIDWKYFSSMICIILIANIVILAQDYQLLSTVIVCNIAYLAGVVLGLTAVKVK